MKLRKIIPISHAFCFGKKREKKKKKHVFWKRDLKDTQVTWMFMSDCGSHVVGSKVKYIN